MKLLIELPTWLGDAVMATPAIEQLVEYYDDPVITLIGSQLSLSVFKFHPNINEFIVINKKYQDLYKLVKKLDKFDAFFSFRSSIRSKFVKFLIKADIKHQFNPPKNQSNHLVLKYSSFIGDKLKIDARQTKLCIYSDESIPGKVPVFNSNKRTLGINPGASYGDAKQWYPGEFAAVASELASQYDIIIFGSQAEINIANEIELLFRKNKIINYKNLAGKTDITELMRLISKLDLFITGDSGPMHLAAAFQVPTVAVFGPTNDTETSQWMNEKGVIVKKNLECQPCMKRTCPLKHHNCMKQVKAYDVLKAVKKFN